MIKKEIDELEAIIDFQEKQIMAYMTTETGSDAEENEIARKKTVEAFEDFYKGNNLVPSADEKSNEKKLIIRAIAQDSILRDSLPEYKDKFVKPNTSIFQRFSDFSQGLASILKYAKGVKDIRKFELQAAANMKKIADANQTKAKVPAAAKKKDEAELQAAAKKFVTNAIGLAIENVKNKTDNTKKSVTTVNVKAKVPAAGEEDDKVTELRKKLIEIISQDIDGNKTPTIVAFSQLAKDNSNSVTIETVINTLPDEYKRSFSNEYLGHLLKKENNNPNPSFALEGEQCGDIPSCLDLVDDIIRYNNDLGTEENKTIYFCFDNFNLEGEGNDLNTLHTSQMSFAKECQVAFGDDINLNFTVDGEKVFNGTVKEAIKFIDTCVKCGIHKIPEALEFKEEKFEVKKEYSKVSASIIPPEQTSDTQKNLSSQRNELNAKLNGEDFTTLNEINNNVNQALESRGLVNTR